jgi:hypothetical protein
VEEGHVVGDFAGDVAAQQQILQDIISAKIPVYSLHSDAHRLQDAYMDIASGKAKK